MSIVVPVIFLSFNIWTLCAALRYSTCMLSTNVCLILIQLSFNIYSYWAAPDQVYDKYNVEFNTTNFIVSIVLSIIFYGLYLYPVIGLISKIKSGVMSQETYPQRYVMELNWIKLNQIESNWIKLNWIELNWIDLQLFCVLIILALFIFMN